MPAHLPQDRQPSIVGGTALLVEVEGHEAEAGGSRRRCVCVAGGGGGGKIGGCVGVCRRQLALPPRLVGEVDAHHLLHIGYGAE